MNSSHTPPPSAPHGVPDAVPGVEVADHPGRARVRRPDREAGAFDVFVGLHVRAEHVPQLLVAALAPQVQVDLSDARHEAVRVAGRPDRTTRVGGLELVRLPGTRCEALPEPVGDVRERDARAIRPHRGHRFGQRTHRAHDEAARVCGVERMLPQPVVRLRVTAPGEGLNQAGIERRKLRSLRGRRRNVALRRHQRPFAGSTARMCTGSVNASSRT